MLACITVTVCSRWAISDHQHRLIWCRECVKNSSVASIVAVSKVKLGLWMNCLFTTSHLSLHEEYLRSRSLLQCSAVATVNNSAAHAVTVALPPPLQKWMCARLDDNFRRCRYAESGVSKNYGGYTGNTSNISDSLLVEKSCVIPKTIALPNCRYLLASVDSTRVTDF